MPNNKSVVAVMALKDLAITVRKVTMKERFDNQEVMLEEAGIAAPLEAQNKAEIDYGIILFHRKKKTYPWQVVRRIYAAKLVTEPGESHY